MISSLKCQELETWAEPEVPLSLVLDCGAEGKARLVLSRQTFAGGIGEEAGGQGEHDQTLPLQHSLQACW